MLLLLDCRWLAAERGWKSLGWFAESWEEKKKKRVIICAARTALHRRLCGINRSTTSDSCTAPSFCLRPAAVRICTICLSQAELWQGTEPEKNGAPFTPSFAATWTPKPNASWSLSSCSFSFLLTLCSCSSWPSFESALDYLSPEASIRSAGQLAIVCHQVSWSPWRCVWYQIIAGDTCALKTCHSQDGETSLHKCWRCLCSCTIQ